MRQSAYLCMCKRNHNGGLVGRFLGSARISILFVMDLEYNISARILAKGGTIAVPAGEILQGIAPADLTEDALELFCREASIRHECKVYAWMDREEYGNANVFNGGSDYEVVNEVCFLCVCECGKELLRERTDRWNDKIGEVL